MRYDNGKSRQKIKSISAYRFFKKLLRLIPDDKKNLRSGYWVIFFNSGLRLLSFYIIGYVIDNFILLKNYSGLIMATGILFVIYILISVSSYYQNRIIGDSALNLLFTLKKCLFEKIQELPITFFEANKTGDLISRINNDTEKLNNFFSGSLLQFVSSAAMLLGSGILLLAVNIRLGIVAIIPSFLILLITRLSSSWIKRWNVHNLESIGNMSSQIHESLDSFKVIVSFNRRDYFRRRFEKINNEHYSVALRAGFVHKVLLPLNEFLSNCTQIIVLAYGIHLISLGDLAIGLLISCLLFTTQFYGSVKVLAGIWPNFQKAIASWERVNEILSLGSNQAPLHVLKNDSTAEFIKFKEVSFSYESSKQVLNKVSFQLERGKTYAFVGPSGGGKTTLVSLLAGLYKPVSGTITFNGKDINAYARKELSRRIGFILQDPFLFSGTVKDNILYANGDYHCLEDKELLANIDEMNLNGIVDFFEDGLETKVSSFSDNISLGQKQLIAFMRAVLRNPELFILDEATANVDTLTESLLNKILKKLPKTTTKIIIAHRLHTVKNADEIFFVHRGKVVPTGSFDNAVSKLTNYKRTS